MSKIILKGQLIILDEDLNAVLAALPGHTALTKNEPGCLVFEVKQNTENANILEVYEEYESREAFTTHQERTRSSSWWDVTQHCDRQYTISE